MDTALTYDEVLKRKAGLSVAFTSAPITQASLFAGRRRQLDQMLDALLQRGLHIVLFGERGVGKTSIASVIKEIAEGAGIAGMTGVAVNCTPADDFESIWQNVFRELEKAAAQSPSESLLSAVGGPTQSLSEALERVLAAPSFGPEDVRFVLGNIGSPLIVLDEVDQIADEEATMLLANTIKTLSDHSVGATILLVGVADSVDGLIKEHASVERNLIQVHMPRMNHDELADIIDKGLSINSMTIMEDAKARIVSLSMGLPQYTHQITKHAAYAALNRGSIQISSQDISSSIEECVDQTQASIRSAYYTATNSPRRDNLFKQVLLACAMTQPDDLGYFAASDVRGPLSRILGKPVTTNNVFKQHLKEFCDPDRGQVLQRKGRARSYRYRFASPMLMTFVVLNGYAKNLIPLDQN